MQILSREKKNHGKTSFTCARYTCFCGRHICKFERPIHDLKDLLALFS